MLSNILCSCSCFTFFCTLINQLLSENGINLNSSHQKDNFLITTSHTNDSFNNNNLNNLNSYAKTTTITSSTNASSMPSTASTPGHFQRQSPTSFEQQLRIFIPNYDDIIDNIRGQQPHSSRAGGSGMSSDRRNMMGDRRMNSSMMDRQNVRQISSSLVWTLAKHVSSISLRSITIHHRRHIAIQTWWTTVRHWKVIAIIVRESARTQAITKTAGFKETGPTLSPTVLRGSDVVSKGCQVSHHRLFGRTITISRWIKIKYNRIKIVTIITKIDVYPHVTTITTVSRSRRLFVDKDSENSNNSNRSHRVRGISTQHQFSNNPRLHIMPIHIILNTHWWSKWTIKYPSAYHLAMNKSGLIQRPTFQFVRISSNDDKKVFGD